MSNIQVFKDAPNLGIHGTKAENIESIMKNGFSGHYYFIGENERRLPNEEFSERLRASVYDAFKMSSIQIYWQNGIKVERKPCLLMLVEKENQGILMSNSSPTYSYFGESFPVGESILRAGEFVDIYPVTISDEEINEISKRFIKRHDLTRIKGLEISSAHFTAN